MKQRPLTLPELIICILLTSAMVIILATAKQKEDNGKMKAEIHGGTILNANQ